MIRKTLIAALLTATLGLGAALAWAPAPNHDRGAGIDGTSKVEQLAWRRWYYRPYVRPYGPVFYRPFVPRPVIVVPPPPPVFYGPPGVGVYVW